MLEMLGAVGVFLALWGVLRLITRQSEVGWPLFTKELTLVGWIAGASVVLVFILTSGMWEGYYPFHQFGGTLLIAIFLAAPGGLLGGFAGGRLAKNPTRAGQIVSAAFFGALGGLLLGSFCFIQIMRCC